jgi:hypothetical protein
LRYDDFNQCEPEARKLASKLAHLGHIAIVTYGAYHPTTDPNLWDERWQIIYAKELRRNGNFVGFVHFWVECNNLILDTAAKQFGEAENIMLNLPDKRYEKFGFVNSFGKKIHTPNKPEIIWNFRSIPA